LQGARTERDRHYRQNGQERHSKDDLWVAVLTVGRNLPYTIGSSTNTGIWRSVLAW
jgi:hypothetical protein